MTAPKVYDPRAGLGRRPLQAVRPLPEWQAVALYFYMIGWTVAVLGVFFWAIR